MLRSTFLHSGWEFAEEGWTGEGTMIGTVRPTWLPAQVPGHVHLDLVENGVIADPFVRMNELGCQWVDEKNWVYRTSFEFHQDESLPRRVLHFEGLDTIATVHLNGEPLGQSDNMFVPLELDVTDKLRVGTNELQIRFESAVLEGRKRRSEYLAEEGIPENVYGLDDRAFVRKAQYMYGWDWGPRLVSCGIWKPVRLIEYAARILDLHAIQHWREDGSVEVRLSCETEGPGLLALSLVGQGQQIPETEPGVFVVAEPKLWWPERMGPQTLYQATASLSGEASGEVDDRATVRIGLRTIKLLRQADSHGESFEFEVNGTPLWIRGANWIPDHSFPSLVSADQYCERIAAAADLGCNMLRIWGGGLYESEEFYEICDREGILVWQDFPFACSYYPENEEFKQSVAGEAYTNVKRLRNHPSLAIWCGNNENQAMWYGKWGGPERSPSRHYGLKLYEETIPAVLAKTDLSRPYVESSPIWGSTEDDRANPGEGGFGDQHYWDVWHGRGDWRHYADSNARFCSEYGFASSCSREVWDTVLDPSDDHPDSSVVRWHDKTGKGWDKFLEYAKLHYPDPETLEDWIYYSQLNQRDAIRFGLEHFRRSEFCKGSLIWQLNDCWPVQSWAMIDSKGNYKAVAYELRRLHRDVLYSLVRDRERVQLWAINDSHDSQAVKPFIEVRQLASSEVMAEMHSEDELQPGERRSVLEISIEGLCVPEIVLVGGDKVAPTWQLAAEPKSARFAEPCPLTISTHSAERLQVRAETPLVDLFLSCEGSTRPFRTNFVTVPKPGVFDIWLNENVSNLNARSLAGHHAVKLVRGPLE